MLHDATIRGGIGNAGAQERATISVNSLIAVEESSRKKTQLPVVAVLGELKVFASDCPCSPLALHTEEREPDRKGRAREELLGEPTTEEGGGLKAVSRSPVELGEAAPARVHEQGSRC
jgi:hypothetical protein